MKDSKTSVGVIFGGNSGEHDVSIKSALTIIDALQHEENLKIYHVIPLYIDLQGRWWESNIANKALIKGTALGINDLPKPIPPAGFRKLPKDHHEIDVWFPILHGPNGEDGTVQGLLKLIGKPFVGSGVLGSAVGMDKITMKAVFESAGLPQVKYFPVDIKELRLNSINEFQILINKIENKLKYPYFIKPANLGSSVGITKAKNKEELILGLQKASILDKRIIIEEGIVARELECSALGHKDLRISEVGEINLQSSDWYDYETKYSEISAPPLIPAPIPKSVRERVQNLTKDACEAISAIGLARVDFFYTDKNNDLFINEINTLPGFTTNSMYPSLWEASGFTIQKLVAHLVETARN